MNFRVALSSLLALLLAGCSSGGLYRWVPFAGHGKTEAVPGEIKPSKSGPLGPITGPVYYGLEMRLKVAPEVIKLSDTHSLEARLQLINRRKKKPVTLQFNDSRHYDFILRDASGKKLAQWSDDQPLNQTPGYVIINPDERAEFVGNISTRDMVAGRSYTLEALVVGYGNMRQTVTLAP